MADKLNINKEKFAATARDRFREAREFLGNWRSTAIDDYNFISGNQWLAEDEEILRAQKRPPITFNYSEKMIDAVIGAEVSARQEVSYLPRQPDDAPLTELWNNAAKWVRDECGAEDEESDAFKDMLICGLGWTHTFMAYDEDLDGMVDEDRIDPLEMYYDPAAIKPGLMDRRYHYRIYWADKRAARDEWPNAALGGDDGDNTGSDVIIHGQRYNDEGMDGDLRARHKDQVQIRHYETYEYEDIHRVADVGGSLSEYNDAEFAERKEQFDSLGLPYVKQKRKVYYQAWFSGDTLLEVMKSPCQEGFTYQCITGKRDRNKNYWYGLTRVMKDPQRWANKWLSQILHIINSNAKGGIMAEIGAFVDPMKAQDEWSQPDSVTLLREGGIEKVKEKQQHTYPAGLDKLMGFALESLPMVTGINLEALGLANREQAGVLEAQRKQAAYGLLSGLFDALRRYRKQQGRITLYFVTTYISDGRLVRIGGADSKQYLPLTKQPGAVKYDVVVDQAPSSPDVKDKTWETLVQILPAMMKAGLPVAPDLLDYTPLPVALVTKWKAYIQQNSGQMNPQQAQQMQQQLQQLQQENTDLKNNHDAEMAQVQLKAQVASAELQMKKEQMHQEMQLEQVRMQNELQLAQEKNQQELRLNASKAETDTKLAQRKVDNDFKVKSMAAATSGGSPAGSGDDGAGGGNVTINMDHGLAAVLEQLAQSSQQMTQFAQQGGGAIQQSIAQLTQALQKPRRLVKDATGRPIGSMTE